MKKTAFLFPGQGSQSVGMGLDFYQEYDGVREIFDMAEEITRINISRLCFKGPFDELTQTVNLQPSVTAVNLACLFAIEKEGVRPDISAGHSLGEYSAMHASNVVSKEDTIRLVFKRGELMHREATQYTGSMHAIIGLPINTVEELVAEVQKEGIVAVANHNTKQQIVITGAPDMVKKVSALAASRGAKAIPLKVSGAWHSELIKGAQEKFGEFMESVHFSTPDRPMLFNVTGDYAINTDDIKSIMVRQLCSPVKWYDSVRRLMAENVEIFVEVGPGKVLTGLIKKILPKDYPCKIYTVNSMKQMERFLKQTT
ncbi:MAG: ACP S-malonyltransferase [Deltaproteobacteria bacterium]|nr:ACP S-malonyltransferase [Deltaproteobacteria bacterium]MBW1958186.1 ACP S-malonyltransferase [Deltaproteobacteria bacterium]MBW2012750.1 ACP S-malonyltransferase [Deltaproteobacteria bacterium]MBW2087745.1 ACP S-malonyltransferase [Deltaproteobacteria bacterium]MBW2320672.1 ACP S-malonyltransferase [Deltaproteobacteria bacterium]